MYTKRGNKIVSRSRKSARVTLTAVNSVKDLTNIGEMQHMNLLYIIGMFHEWVNDSLAKYTGVKLMRTLLFEAHQLCLLSNSPELNQFLLCTEDSVIAKDYAKAEELVFLMLQSVSSILGTQYCEYNKVETATINLVKYINRYYGR